jgi:hypothetical protein
MADWPKWLPSYPTCPHWYPSPAIGNPFRRLGRSGFSLDSLLSRQFAGHDEPVVLVLHLACPRVDYTDRGKSAVIISNLTEEE